LLLVFALAAGLGAGCAARRPAPAATPAPVTAPAVPGQAATPTVPGTASSATISDAFPPLPGTGRVYPSQDPRNRAVPGAPEAFPPPGAMAGSVVQSGVAESGEGAPAEESVAEDARAATATEGPTAGASVAVVPSPSSGWSVQLLASSSLPVARERAEALAPFFPEPPRVEPAGGLFKVRVGRCATRDEAEALRRKALGLGLRDAFVVPSTARGEPRR
jgi:hypothetical protein